MKIRRAEDTAAVAAGGPAEHLTWYWQLQGTVNNSESVAAYDIDGFENIAAEVATLHAQGKHVICYIDVGTYEPGRPDASWFPAAVAGGEVSWLAGREVARHAAAWSCSSRS